MKRIVIKVGSSLVTHPAQGLDVGAIQNWCEQIAALKKEHKEVVLVSSGAIAAGMLKLGFKARPTDIHLLQACAAVGQMDLAQCYETSFRAHHIHTAQILLTHADLVDRERYLNARVTIRTLLSLGVVPIINENDTVVTDEIKLGDNDTLGALVANLIEADALIILTDQKGVFTKDPREDETATLIETAPAGEPYLETIAGGAGSHIGRGGMITKILAAKRAAKSGADTFIASGREKSVLTRLIKGESLGTHLTAQHLPLAARKQWLLSHLQTNGQFVLDDGAVYKLRHEGKSLLPIGVVAVIGEFKRGDAVTCIDSHGQIVARGLTNYGSTDAHRIKQQPSQNIANILGFIEAPELIHRDNLVLL